MPLPYDLEAVSPSRSFSSAFRHRRSFPFYLNPHRRIVLLITVGSLAFVIYFNKFLPFSLHTATIDFPTTQDQLALLPSQCPVRPTPFLYPSNSSNLYLVFTPADPAPADITVRRIGVHDEISDECLEEWFREGKWSGACLNLKMEEPRIDLVWTWVNGSDPLHLAAREAHPIPPPKPPQLQPSSANKEKQYRQHDELRYSVRSATAATKSWKRSTFHLVANSYSLPLPPYEGEGKDVRYGLRLGQVPQWLDLWKIGDEAPSLTIHHDVDIFHLLPSSPNKEILNADLAAWREVSLPTFNSLAVESQLANLPADDVSDITVFIMDDNFILRPLSTSSFYSPIHGPVLQLQPDLLVDPAGKHPNPPGWSEWRGLETAASRLSERFGSRGRPYMVHNARSIPLPLLHEGSLAFPLAFSSTATSRFRGQDPSRPETHTLWLATQFIVERHREALLWSWVVGKWGSEKGSITREDKEKMWLEVGGESGEEETEVPWPKRDSRLNSRQELQTARLPDSWPTNYAFLSSDGYPYTYLPLRKYYPLPPHQNGWADFASGETRMACKIDRKQCFSNDSNEPAVEMLKRIMVDNPTCGDCIISALINLSGPTGFSAFLPPPTPPQTSTSHPSSTPTYLPLTLPSLLTFPYPSNNPRLFALRLIQRYSYVLGATPNRFFGATSASDTALRLKVIDTQDKDLAFLCINDDMSTTDPSWLALMDTTLQSWMKGRWPHKLEFERDETEAVRVMDHRQDDSCV
ncbi:hypothetical protein BDZ97DRAFT_1811431 [Flammula alnicola]|nr:hypothetical protein BDZ97DRAFT_1811431 [Flammula alnicola]